MNKKRQEESYWNGFVVMVSVLVERCGISYSIEVGEEGGNKLRIGCRGCVACNLRVVDEKTFSNSKVTRCAIKENLSSLCGCGFRI